MKLFQSVFGFRETHGVYPESLIDAAIERAVDDTDSRLRLLPGYKKLLRKPVIHAIDHVVALVDGIASPVSADRKDYGAEPRLAALFSSAAAMQEIFSRDASLVAFLSGPSGPATGRVATLLLATRMDRNILGMELAGGQVQRDVRQIAVSFDGHRLLDPTGSDEETRRQLRRRAFDHLLSLALARISEARIDRADLTRQRDLLKRKLAALTQAGWSFEAPEGEHSDPAALVAELDAVTAQLHALGADSGVLRAHLDIIVALLGEAEHQLLAREVTLFLDPMNIQRDAGYPTARQIVLQELHSASGRAAVMLPISFALGELPPREDFVTAAERYLY